jgi:hypothetical protein
MLCDFGDNSPRVLDDPVTVSCKVCNQSYTVRVFPVYAECAGDDDFESVLQCVRAKAIEEVIARGEFPAESLLLAFNEFESRAAPVVDVAHFERVEPFSGERFKVIDEQSTESTEPPWPTDHADATSQTDSAAGDERIGLGDVVAGAIKVATMGLIPETVDCGCEKRKAWLNKLFSWKRWWRK